MADERQNLPDVQEGNVWRNLFTFSLLIISVPVFLYFFTKAFVFEKIFELTSQQSYLYAAVVAVVSVQILLGLFIYVAFKEGSEKPYKRD